MATPTYDLLDSTTLASSASSVTFTSIDQGYRDLVLVTTLKGTQDDSLQIKFNGDSGSNYKLVEMVSTPSGVNSTRGTYSSIFANVLVFTVGADKSQSIFQIMDYAQTDKYKPVHARATRVTDGNGVLTGSWNSTAAINSIEITASSASFLTDSTFYLYGIAG